MKRKGFTLIELLVVISIIAVLMCILMPALNRARMLAIQLVCGTNLKGIASAMMVYARDNMEDYPRAGGAGSIWSAEGKILYWDGGLSGTEYEAFGVAADEETGEITYAGAATITSSFFYLVKYAGIPPKQFVCRGDEGYKEFKMSYFPYALVKDMKRAWDFGDGSVPNRIYPGEFVSYTYQMPYSRSRSNVTSFGIIDQSNPSTPIAADRNPNLDKNTPTDGSANSMAHRQKGQNVVYKDGSASFEDNPNVGMGGDNIYTCLTSTGGEFAPTREGQRYPWDDKDAYLVSERNFRTTP
jgi:prepilin-type N-terminal cleavage/methylation domain-containing protein